METLEDAGIIWLLIDIQGDPWASQRYDFD